MAKTKIYKDGWKNTPNAFYVGAMRTTDERNATVETENAAWKQTANAFHTAFATLDDAYQQSQVSLSTQTIAQKDEERDLYGQVIEQVAKQWARMPDEAMALHGRRVYQVLRDINFRTTEALVAENEKVVNIEQRFMQEATLKDDLAKWADLVSANDKALAVDPSTDRIVSLAPRAKKVGGLYLALAGRAVRPTDPVDAKRDYDLLPVDGSSSGSDVTPVRPE